MPPEMKAAQELRAQIPAALCRSAATDHESPIDYQLFAEVPVELMVRHQFVPLKKDAKGLYIAMADPTDLERLDELSATLRTRVIPHVATAGAVEVVLRKATRRSACCRKRLQVSVSRWCAKLSRRRSSRSRSTGDRR
jgi:type IV pilus assembly protein PilB